MIVPKKPRFVVLNRDDLDRVGERCHYCGRLISGREAPDAGEIVSITSGRKGFVHGHCARGPERAA